MTNQIQYNETVNNDFNVEKSTPTCKDVEAAVFTMMSWKITQSGSERVNSKIQQTETSDHAFLVPGFSTLKRSSLRKRKRDSDTFSVNSLDSSFSKSFSGVHISSPKAVVHPRYNENRSPRRMRRTGSKISLHSVNSTPCKLHKKEIKLWSESIAVERAEKLRQQFSKQEMRRQESIYELYQGEVSIVNDLHLAIKIYRDSLLHLSILTPEELAQIFGTMHKLLSTHQELSHQLSAIQNKDLVTDSIGDVILHWIPSLRCYSEYCSNLVSAKELVDLKKSQDKRFQDFLQRCLESSFSRKLDLWNFLELYLKMSEFFPPPDVPRSRLVKYPLLLRNILKVTPPQHKDIQLLAEAVNNSDVDYEPMESDNETIATYECDDVDLSEHEDDGVMLSDSWKRIADIFSDCRPNSLPELVCNFSGVNPALNCNANNSVLDCFKKFITNDVIDYLVKCINDRANISLKRIIKLLEEIISDVDKESGKTQCQFFIDKIYHINEDQCVPELTAATNLICSGVLKISEEQYKLDTFLFDTVLVMTRPVICSSSGKKLYQIYRQPIPVSQLVVEILRDGEVKMGSFKATFSTGQISCNLFKVVDKNNVQIKHYTLQASNEHIKKQWISSFQKVSIGIVYPSIPMNEGLNYESKSFSQTLLRPRNRNSMPILKQQLSTNTITRPLGKYFSTIIKNQFADPNEVVMSSRSVYI
ncbi:Rho guanine nucleotide exchange factor 3 [Nymphon striatum]|nr:Rho guanine nucleotide exchange factor 3 [Nymphon striatum]